MCFKKNKIAGNKKYNNFINLFFSINYNTTKC